MYDGDSIYSPLLAAFRYAISLSVCTGWVCAHVQKTIGVCEGEGMFVCVTVASCEIFCGVEVE